MSVLPVKDFFNNKVNIQLKSGQRFEGLLSRIDYKSSTIVLEDVQDLGNEFDKLSIPHDKKYAEKSFEADNINEIFLRDKHFSEPKKYKKEEFWDAISEPQSQQHKKYKAKYDESMEYRPKRNYDNYDKRRGNNTRKREDRPYERRENNPRQKQQQPSVQPQERELR